MNMLAKSTKKNNRFAKEIDKASKHAKDHGLIDLGILDQIPDDDSHNKGIPFPYGGDSNFNAWNDPIKKDC